MKYFCLDSKGKLWDLCDCGDFDAAEESAVDMGVEPIWIFAENDAKEESIWDVLVESLLTVFDSSIPLYEKPIEVLENVNSLVDNLNTS